MTQTWKQFLESQGIRSGCNERKPMGQGFYTVLAWGCVHDFDDGDGGEKKYNWVEGAAKAHGVQGRTAYEAKQKWMGFFIAENGSGVSDTGDGCELFSYQVFDVADIQKEVEKRWPAQLAKCKAAFDTLKKTTAAHGVKLPRGRLMLVNDYD